MSLEVKTVNIAIGVKDWLTIPEELSEEMGNPTQMEMRLIRDDGGKIAMIVLNRVPIK